MIVRKLTTVMMVLIAAGMVAGIFIRPLLVPWLLSSALFILNYSLSLLFMRPISQLATSAAAGVALLSFFLRFGLLGLGLIAVALALPEYFLTTAICFLLVYTLFLGLEIAVGIRGNTVPDQPAAGGEA